MQAHVLRLPPGSDLRAALDACYASLAAQQGVTAACVVAVVGSLSQAVLRYAGAPGGTLLAGPLELLTLSGTLSADGAHLHATVADAQGQVRGGHAMPGCVVRTTAELVLALLPGWQFTRVADASTGFQELVATRL